MGAGGGANRGGSVLDRRVPLERAPTAAGKAKDEGEEAETHEPSLAALAPCGNGGHAVGGADGETKAPRRVRHSQPLHETQPMLKRILAAGALTLSLAAAPVHAQDASEKIDIAIGSVQAVDLAGTLTEGEPVTVFVPSDEALGALPTDALAAVRGDPDKLKQVINAYVVSGTVTAADVKAMLDKGESTIKTMNGDLKVTAEGDKIMLEGATGKAEIIATDMKMGNVTVHVINGAFLPEGVTASD